MSTGEVNQDSVVCTTTGYGLGDGGFGVQVPIGSRIFSYPRYQTGTGVHSASSGIGKGGYFAKGKAAGV
jgi:hypothetical protein